MGDEEISFASGRFDGERAIVKCRRNSLSIGRKRMVE